MGQALFNLYVNDLDEVHDYTAFQCADDATLITHCVPSKLDGTTVELNDTMRTLKDWSSNLNLLLNGKKTKQMIITTNQMSRQHKLDNQNPRLKPVVKFLKEYNPSNFSVCGYKKT